MTIIETAKVTTKGQVTIPSRIRKILHLEEGSSVAFGLTKEGVVPRKNMKSKFQIIFLGVLLFAFQFLLPCNAEYPQLIHFDEQKTESEFLTDINKFPYEISKERKSRILDNYSKLAIGIPKEQVIILIGKPDFSTGLSGKSASSEITGIMWTYYFYKEKNNLGIADTDIRVNLSFDTEGKLTSAWPSGIKGLKEIR